MDINTVIKKLKQVLNEKKLQQLGKSSGLIKRERNVTLFQLVIALICTLGGKETTYLSEILRMFNHLTRQRLQYKPFHNQLSKPELAGVMKQVMEQVLHHWVNEVLHFNQASFSRFKQISIQDGSMLIVNRNLKKKWPCRFKHTCAAAVKVHATLDLMQGCFHQVSLTADTFSERAAIPELKALKNHLFLADRGYYSGDFILKLDEAGGYYVLRAKGLTQVRVHRAIREDGQEMIKRPSRICVLEKRLPKRQMIDMDVEVKGKMTRLIAFWSLKEKRYTHLITNLKRTEFSMREISHIYRLRWQVELLFKECKSYNNLHGFNTQKASLQEALIWTSLIAMTLKRFMSGSIEQIFKVEMSTMNVSKTTTFWWYGMLEAIVQKNPKELVNQVTTACEFLKDNARRAHPKRDKQTGVFQYGIEPSFYEDFNPDMLVRV